MLRWQRSVASVSGLQAGFSSIVSCEMRWHRDQRKSMTLVLPACAFHDFLCACSLPGSIVLLHHHGGYAQGLYPFIALPGPTALPYIIYSHNGSGLISLQEIPARPFGCQYNRASYPSYQNDFQRRAECEPHLSAVHVVHCASATGFMLRKTALLELYNSCGGKRQQSTAISNPSSFCSPS